MIDLFAPLLPSLLLSTATFALVFTYRVAYRPTHRRGR